MIKQRLPQKETLDKSQPRDLFQTPQYATELLIPFIPKSTKHVWECAAGEGKIADVLERHGYTVTRTDIRNCDNKNAILNFLTEDSNILDDDVVIITNPPFSLKKKFFEKCIKYETPFGLLLSADYNLWGIDAIRKYRCVKIIPDHRINYVTPTGKSEATGHSSYFHSFWLTRYFIDPKDGRTEIFVELTKEMKKNI